MEFGDGESHPAKNTPTTTAARRCTTRRAISVSFARSLIWHSEKVEIRVPHSECPDPPNCHFHITKMLVLYQKTTAAKRRDLGRQLRELGM